MLTLLLWTTSLACWSFILAGHGTILPHGLLCGGAADRQLFAGLRQIPVIVLLINWPGLLAGALPMIGAMMAPALQAPLLDLRRRTYVRRRTTATVSFVCAYLAVWLPTCVALSVAATLATDVIGNAVLAAAFVAFAGMIWCLSPLRSPCLNRSVGRRGPARERPAWIDALRFGALHACRCVNKRWASMMVPLLATRFHVPLMIACTLIIMLERDDPVAFRLRTLRGKVSMKVSFGCARWRALRRGLDRGGPQPGKSR